VTNLKNISKKIREIRTKNGHTLEELGEKLNLNPSNLSKIERGIRKPQIELVEQIANIYNVPLSYFFGETAEAPEELKKLGAEWVAFAEEMEDREITPEEIRAILEVLNKVNKS
jgi:transcriptional regulator with XRE-family HTH domain